MVTQPKTSWVLLSYRIPREPSTPRIAIWRRLKKLGVVQVGDGLVGLPHDARTKEHLEWVSAMVADAAGDATVWIATTTKSDSDALARSLNEARRQEYQALLDEVNDLGADVGGRTLARLRREWRRIDRRDYLRAPLRDEARLAIAALAPSVAGAGSTNNEAESEVSS